MELDYTFMRETFFTVWEGAGVTLSLTALSLLLAMIPAFYFAVVRMRGDFLLSPLVRLYVSFVRGTPIILQILLLYSLLPSLINALLQAIGSDFNIFDAVEPFWYAVIIFTFNTIALLSEVFRSALLAIPKGQLEAGLSVGMSQMQTYVRVIIPQALVVALPAIANLTVNLIKGTSLAFLMTVKDVMALGRIAASYGYNYIEAYIDVFIVYIVLCSVVQAAYHLAEKRLGAFRQMT
ncbi:amino acid ABC transporter permease [Selenomonas sp. TAMA-11512]|uniref:amino acid ABC transporter permease n=1 Tax=Selenomonas sp. TAMA-11512 TaxID=3095337 RepID=UPI0030867030|nr:amino acid ABC transporter permease [Selenomonas sp. TAMA-11512]